MNVPEPIKLVWKSSLENWLTPSDVNLPEALTEPFKMNSPSPSGTCRLPMGNGIIDANWINSGDSANYCSLA